LSVFAPTAIFLPDKEQAEILRRKLWTFAEAIKTRKRLSLTLLTTYGLNRNINSSGLVETVLTLEDLFLE
jgi:hypothetical protein